MKSHLTSAAVHCIELHIRPCQCGKSDTRFGTCLQISSPFVEYILNYCFKSQIDLGQRSSVWGRGLLSVTQTPFNLRGGSSAFSNRSHSIFECLDSVARLASSSMSQDKSADGVFARPLPPRSLRKTSQPQSICPTPAKKRGVPDYLVHPERWTHYNLEDVEETSDQDNRKCSWECVLLHLLPHPTGTKIKLFIRCQAM
uniref:U5 small nuclear ribonucleoprotein TSSC4 n=1 Tax=Gasterosteus aculeatus aculeatus TaxID=481459 RepID=A0AAQ4QZ67_GASAC